MGACLCARSFRGCSPKTPNQGESEMKFNAFSTHVVSRVVIASAMIVMLGVTASAQTAQGLRTPRRLFNGRSTIRKRQHYLCRWQLQQLTQHCAGARRGSERWWTGVRRVPGPASVGTTVDLRTSDRPLRRSIKAGCPVQLLNTARSIPPWDDHDSTVSGHMPRWEERLVHPDRCR